MFNDPIKAEERDNVLFLAWAIDTGLSCPFEVSCTFIQLKNSLKTCPVRYLRVCLVLLTKVYSVSQMFKYTSIKYILLTKLIIDMKIKRGDKFIKVV